MNLVQAVDPTSFTTAFPNLPFSIKHDLASHPLLTLPKIAELVRTLPGDRIEFNSGKAAINQDPNAVPLVDMEPEEIVRRIETAGAWMVLKRIETEPAYRVLVEAALWSVAAARGHASLESAGFEDIQGFLFVSSPGATTPFHCDSEDNFFVHVHGEKFFHVYDNRDHTIASEAELEHSAVKHRNVPYDPRFDDKGTCYSLLPGDGVFVPYQWPHWVRTGNSYSISLAITWKTKEVRRRNDLYIVNSLLRGMKLPQPPQGRKPVLDAVKLAVFRTGTAVVSPLRKSEAMRRVLRMVALGKNANYYYRDPAKKQEAA
jgi:hypothetical protein